jgi:hypothetical protein
MITPSFGLTATERVLPKLALDFTTASLDNRITFTRTGATATVINSSGNVEVVNADTPRFVYNPTTLVCNGLLIEETRINSIRNNTMVGAVVGSPGTQPTNWSSNWAGTVNGLTFSIAGLGTESGIDYVDISIAGTSTSAGALFNLFETANSTPALINQNWAASLYIKVVSGSQGNMGVQNYIRELSAVGGITAATATNMTLNSNSLITNRFVTTRTLTGALTAFIASGIRFAPDGSSTYNMVLRIGLPQMEQGAFATSVIKTSTAAVTRNADVATMTGANFSDWYSAGAGGVVVRVLPSTVSGTRPALQFDDATADEVIALRGNTTNPELVIVDGGSPQAQIDAGTIAANTAYNLGAAWNTDNCAAAVNGGAAVTDTSATIPTVTQARLGSDGTNYLNGNIQTLRYWPQRIIDAEVQAFSK